MCQIIESDLQYPREDYGGGIFLLSLQCSIHTGLKCIVFKLKGNMNFNQGI